MQTTIDAKTLASPRLLVLNGQTSRLQVGDRLGYRVVTVTETASLETVDFLDVGIVLSVTPRISRDGRIVMNVKPKISTGAVNPDTGQPEEDTTQIETDLILNDGQGMIIGGLIQERDDVRQSKIPLIGDLWLIGKLFQRSEVNKRRTEIIVALTPHLFPYDLPARKRNARELQWHMKSHEMVYFLTPGAAMLEGKDYTFEKGDLVILDPGEKHEWTAPDNDVVVFDDKAFRPSQAESYAKAHLDALGAPRKILHVP